MRRADSRHVRALLLEKGPAAFTEMALTYGRTFRHAGLVATCEPEIVRALLMERPHAERRAPVHKVMGLFPGANGILFMDGPKWLRRARAVMPVFRQPAVDAFAASIHETTMAHVARWRTGRQPDLFDAVQQLGAAAILRMGYGLDPGDPHAAALGRAVVDYKQFTMAPDSRRLDEFGLVPSKLLALPKIAAGIVAMHRKARAVEAAVGRLREAAPTGNGRPDWVNRLAEAGLRDKELADELNHLYGAYSAIDYVVAAALYELGRRPELAARLRRELATSGVDAPPSRAQLARLPLTGGFILEILRRYPVTMGAVRMTGAPLQIDGETIPAGTQVMILLHALHHHPDFWDDPEELRPERWMASPAPRVPFSYVPFLDGSRKCIGRHMAEMQLLVVLAAVLRAFDVRVFGEAVLREFIIPRFVRPIPFAIERAPAA